MNNNDYLKRFRGMIDVQNRKNTITGALVLVGIMAVLMPGSIFWFVKSDYVTYPLLTYLGLFTVGAAAVKRYSKSRLSRMHLDSRDLSLIIDADHPIAQDVIMRTRETGNFTYADLNQILAGYERLSAASEYAITGVNKKLRVNTANNGKLLRIADRPLKHISLNMLVFVIILAQLGVAAGILPTLHEVFTGQPLPKLSLNLSIREIVTQIAIPRGITIGVLYFVRLLITKRY
ncbi:hypothetical protein F2P70_06180 [Shigella sonnei]|nr:hypothetical protein [Salmonella enterica subsp. enterica serovar Newport]EFW1825069.1 hypothetical protein [Shigella sonnei]